MVLLLSVYIVTFLSLDSVCNGSSRQSLVLSDSNACDSTKKTKGNRYNAPDTTGRSTSGTL